MPKNYENVKGIQMNEFGRILLWCCLQASLFGLIVSGLYCLARRLGPQAGATIAFSGLVGFILIGFMAVSPWPRWEVGPVVATTDSRHHDVESARVTAAEFESADGTVVGPPALVPSPTFFDNFFDAFQDAMKRPVETAVSPTWMFWIGVSFLVGFVGFVLWRIVGVMSVWAQVRNSRVVDDRRINEQLDILCARLRVTSQVQLRESGELESAATVGVRTPIILLPRQWRTWDEDERRVVLSHELAHASRRDFLFLMMTQLGVAAFFYHPLVHWLSRRFRLEQELAADAMAAQVTGGREKYLSHLANLALRTATPAIRWPAHAFIPTRSTFLRRLEMLRRPNPRNPENMSSATAGFSLTTVLAIAFVICGFRLPSDLLPAGAVMAQTTAASEPESSSLDWRLFPVDAAVYIGIRPAEVFANDTLAPILAQANQAMQMQEIPFKIEEIAELWWLTSPQNTGRVIVRTTKPVKGEDVVFQLLTQPTQVTYEERKYYLDSVSDRAVLLVDDRTVVVDEPKRVEHLIETLSNPGNKPNWAESIEIVSGSQLALVAHTTRLGEITERLKDAPAAQMFSPLLTDVTKFRIQATLSGKTELNLFADTIDDDAAKRVATTIDAGVVLARNLIAQQKKEMQQQPNVSAELRAQGATIFSLLENELLLNAKTTVTGSTAKLTASGGEGGDSAVVLGTLLPAINASREAARRTQSINNMKQIALAMHNYQSTHGRLPSPVMLGPDGKTPHSWRVALLPYLDQADLHERYRFNEPWDSQHNRTLMQEIPTPYRSPNDKQGSVNTSFFAIAGKDSFLGDSQPKPRGEGRRLRDIKDGTSKTLAFVEANREIPWTKPEDVQVEPGLQKRLGGWHSGDIFIAARGDASVQAISRNIDEKVFQALLSANGAEPIRE